MSRAGEAKGKLTLHDLDGDLGGGKRWSVGELILDVLKPARCRLRRRECGRQGGGAAVTQWIEAELRKAVAQAKEDSIAPQARRLTNFEYENTIRDLIGFRLKLTDNLPKDPEKPYHFNNTAEFMLLGPEQVDRYLENARKVMASAIVDSAKPEARKARREWQPHGLDRGIGVDEVGVWGNRRHSPAHGMGLKSFPDTGEFVIRVQASAILPPGVKGAPLRLLLGQTIRSTVHPARGTGGQRLRGEQHRRAGCTAWRTHRKLPAGARTGRSRQATAGQSSHYPAGAVRRRHAQRRQPQSHHAAHRDQLDGVRGARGRRLAAGASHAHPV